MTDPTDTSLRAAIERAYDEIQQRKGKPRRYPLKALRQNLSRLQDRDRFIALCQREWAEEDRWKRDAAKTRAPRSVVKEWVEEYKTAEMDATTGAAAHFSFPLIYVSHVAVLAQAQGELDLREETVRRLLGGETFEDAVAVAAMPAWQRRAGSRERKKPRPLKGALDQIKARTLDDLLSVLDDSERMADLYCSTVSPIDITDVEVDRDARVVHYRTRRQSPAEQTKSVSFKRLREVLAGLTG